MNMNEIITRYLGRSATGVVVAVAVDYHAFTRFKSFDEFAKYDWKLVGFRACQGAVIGLVGGLFA